jgi:hypothetical protein
MTLSGNGFAPPGVTTASSPPAIVSVINPGTSDLIVTSSSGILPIITSDESFTPSAL